jgi:hypothetical protein
MMLYFENDFLKDFPTDCITVRELALKISDLSITPENNRELFLKIHSAQIKYIFEQFKEEITKDYDIKSSMYFSFLDRHFSEDWNMPVKKDNEYHFKGTIFLNPEFFTDEENYGIIFNTGEERPLIVPNKFNRFIIFDTSHLQYKSLNGFGDGKEFSRLTIEHEISIKFYK